MSHVAVFFGLQDGCLECVHMLIDGGADIQRQPEGWDGRSPSWLASQTASRPRGTQRPGWNPRERVEMLADSSWTCVFVLWYIA